MKQKTVSLFDVFVSRRSGLVRYQPSVFAKRNQAVALRNWQDGGRNAKASYGEIANIHSTDGSLHMIFSASDAKTVIETGWGECHPLAGELHLPDTYLLVYPPRNDRELAVTARLLDAAFDNMSCCQ